MKSRIDRTLRQIESASTPLAQLLDDGIAVRRPILQRSQDKKIKMSFKQLRTHT